VIAGVPLATAAFRLVDPRVAIEVLVEDGERVTAGTTILRLSGSPRSLLSAERVALNFMQRLSGTATLTARYVDAVRGTAARILDTRKTTPLLRALEKYAVRAGGGMNHRSDLADAVLIKDNHIAALGGDTALAVRRARERAPAGTRVEVECESVAQVSVALSAGADIVLLECIPAALGKAITAALHVPVIGIGAGPDTDGQILVTYDILDITTGRKPRFVRNFMEGAQNNLEALEHYVRAVKQREYPAPEHCF
jgi:nicotinate-nucleotide pyrophosphorylase (carboxylating)